MASPLPDDPLVSPPTDRPVLLGRVIGAHGVRGWIKVQPLGVAEDSALLAANTWWLCPPVGLGHEPQGMHPEPKAVLIERSRRHGQTLVAKPQGVEDRSGAECLRGSEIWLSRSSFPALPQGEYYWVDLIGCAVMDPEGRPLGEVRAIDDHGAHPILVLDSGCLIPAVDAFLNGIDLEARRIVADWNPDWST